VLAQGIGHFAETSLNNVQDILLQRQSPAFLPAFLPALLPAFLPTQALNTRDVWHILLLLIFG
jgi:hypothetical protein